MFVERGWRFKKKTHGLFSARLVLHIFIKKKKKKDSQATLEVQASIECYSSYN